MENKNLTAVEWLYKLSKERELDKFDLEQAKQMEEELYDHAFLYGKLFDEKYKDMGNSKMDRKAVFTGQSYGTKITYEFDHSDIDAQEAFDAMMNILIGLTYTHEQIKDLIINLAQQYTMEQNNN